MTLTDDEIRVRFLSFGKLKDGWDSYKAPAPNQASIEAARSFVDAAVAAGMRPDRVAPSVMGGIGVTWRRGELLAYAEFLNGEWASVMLSYGEDEPAVFSINTLTADKVLSWIRPFLDIADPSPDEVRAWFVSLVWQ